MDKRLQHQRILLAPYNDMTRHGGYPLESEIIGYVDGFKKGKNIYHPDELQDVDFDQIWISSPNYFSSIYDKLISVGVCQQKLYFYLPFIHIKTRIAFCATLLFSVYPYMRSFQHYINEIKNKWALLRVCQGKNRTGLESLKNKHENQRIFLIGNGPSLTIEDLSLLANEITFAANKIYLSFPQTPWRPTYYMVEDDLVFKQNFETIDALTGMVKLFPHYAQQWGKTIKNGTYFSVNYHPVDDPKFPLFSDDPLVHGLGWGSTVLYTMIEFAVYFGCKEIYLLGVDFNFTVPKETLLNAQEGRIDLICEGEVNHFHPEYRKVGERWNLPNLEHQYKSFSKAKEWCETHNIKVYNLSRQTCLDVFEKKNFDDIVAQGRSIKDMA